jgi:integrase
VRRPTKTISSEAVLPLPELCVDVLAAHRLMVERWRADAGEAWHENDLVFSTSYGLPLDPRNFHRRFKMKARKAGVPVHSTRRTCASLLVELDVHPRVAMQTLRHSRISITMEIYSKVAAASTREALGRLSTTLVIKSYGPMSTAQLLQFAAATALTSDRQGLPKVGLTRGNRWSQGDSNP